MGDFYWDNFGIILGHYARVISESRGPEAGTGG